MHLAVGGTALLHTDGSFVTELHIDAAPAAVM